MDIIMLIISLIAMVATVVSCFITIKAKNEVKEIVNSINLYKKDDSSAQSKGGVKIKNSGTNSGVIGGVVSGGINKETK